LIPTPVDQGDSVHNSGDIDGDRIRFHLNQPVGSEVIGQPRKIEIDRRTMVVGEVVDVDGTMLVLLVNRRFDDNLPKSGKLIFDISAAETALRRQKDALDAVRFGRAVRTDIKELLSRPNLSRPPKPVDLPSFFQADIDDIKKSAVRAACGFEDFLVVQGPPGTGKTTFIAETILQYLKAHPSARILLTSQTHVALDNVLERMRGKTTSFRFLRLGLSTDRVSLAVHEFLLPQQMDSWRAQVLSRSKQYLDGWADVRSIPKTQVEIGRLLHQYASTMRAISDSTSQSQEIRDMLLKLGFALR
jgi:hypothetical protein